MTDSALLLAELLQLTMTGRLIWVADNCSTDTLAYTTLTDDTIITMQTNAVVALNHKYNIGTSYELRGMVKVCLEIAKRDTKIATIANALKTLQEIEDADEWVFEGVVNPLYTRYRMWGLEGLLRGVWKDYYEGLGDD